MSVLESWRREIAALLPKGFLRRGLEDGALFVSDYPRRCAEAKSVTERLKNAGFEVLVENGLAFLDGSREKYRALMEALPSSFAVQPREETLRLYALAQRLCRAQTPPDLQPLPLIGLTLKYLDAEDPEGLLRRLPPLLAAAQRSHQPLPEAAGRLILHYLSERETQKC